MKVKVTGFGKLLKPAQPEAKEVSYNFNNQGRSLNLNKTPSGMYSSNFKSKRNLTANMNSVSGISSNISRSVSNNRTRKSSPKNIDNKPKLSFMGVYSGNTEKKDQALGIYSKLNNRSQINKVNMSTNQSKQNIYNKASKNTVQKNQSNVQMEFFEDEDLSQRIKLNQKDNDSKIQNVKPISSINQNQNKTVNRVSNRIVDPKKKASEEIFRENDTSPFAHRNTKNNTNAPIKNNQYNLNKSPQNIDSKVVNHKLNMNENHSVIKRGTELYSGNIAVKSENKQNQNSIGTPEHDNINSSIEGPIYVKIKQGGFSNSSSKHDYKKLNNSNVNNNNNSLQNSQGLNIQSLQGQNENQEVQKSSLVDELFNSPDLKNLVAGPASKQYENSTSNSKSSFNNSASKKQASNSQTPQNNNQNNHSSKHVKKVRSIKEFTRTGYQGDMQKKNNQDIAIIYPNFQKNKDSYFLSVCDGHGCNGHDVSRFLKATLPINLEKELNEKNLDVFTSDRENVYKSIDDMFCFTNNILNNSTIDTKFSGSTCVSLFMNLTIAKIITANIGDSRAVMGKCLNGSKFILNNS